MSMISSSSSSLYILVLLVSFLLVVLGDSINKCKEIRCNYDDYYQPGVRFPFKLKEDHHPNHCGYPEFELSCNSETNKTLIELPLSPVQIAVRYIDYVSQSISVYDPYSDGLNLKLSDYMRNASSIIPFEVKGYNDPYLFNCSKELIDHFPKLIKYPSLSHPNNYETVDVSHYSFRILPLMHCTKLPDTLLAAANDNGYVLKWSIPSCGPCEENGHRCAVNNDGQTQCVNPTASTGPIIEYPTIKYPIIKGAIIKSVVIDASFRAFILILLVPVGYLVYRQKEMKEESRVRIQRFLEDYKALKPSRYSYVDIKKITDHFKHKLGQGAYGTVFKGKITSNINVAVKLLNSSMGNGEEFVNEVATIGRIHHVNVVRLVGFCADGFRRALVYEFLPKGSLQQYISSPDAEHFIGWKKMQDIALGIARGIEYLHQGCDKRILHFDIKPDNILLDHNFNPKISDFGLAKLCSKEESIVPMSTIRGTIGYIAPEVFSRNFRNVSYKSDVYSFGMMLLEMVGGGRKNVDVNEENVSQIYYPEWIYNFLEGGGDLQIQIEGEEDAIIAKKLAIVGLWCIQWNPVDRPPMKVVVQMLETEQQPVLPPNPFGSTSLTKANGTVDQVGMKKLELETIAELD